MLSVQDVAPTTGNEFPTIADTDIKVRILVYLHLVESTYMYFRSFVGLGRFV